MIGKKMTGIESLWNITDSGVDEPVPLPKEIMEEHARLVREYTYTIHRRGNLRRVAKAVRDAEEVARANLRAFERRHGLTSTEPQIG